MSFSTRKHRCFPKPEIIGKQLPPPQPSEGHLVSGCHWLQLHGAVSKINMQLTAALWEPLRGDVQGPGRAHLAQGSITSGPATSTALGAGQALLPDHRNQCLLLIQQGIFKGLCTSDLLTTHLRELRMDVLFL